MRPAARAKSGYYPTPPRILDALSHLITNPHHRPGRLLDPCGGDGFAGGFLKRHLQTVDAYAIELDKQRAAQCRMHCTKVLRSDATVSQVQRDAFSVLFLNPPYDTMRNGERAEYLWLKKWTPMLQPQGIGIYIIPEHQHSERVLEYLSTYYRDVSLYRFPDPEYDRFQQTVFIGARVRTPNPSQTVRNYLWRLLRAHSLPVLGDSTPAHTYTLPPLVLQGDIQFDSNWIDPLDMYQSAHTEGLWQDRYTQDLLTFHHTKPVHPLLPLRIGHLTRLIISGLFNNQTILQNGRHWIIKGRGRKHTKELAPITETLHTKDGPEERIHYRTMEQYIPEIRAWDLTEGEQFGSYIIVNC